MILKNSGRPKFKIKHIQPLWGSKITQLQLLRDSMPDATLVSFDIEGLLPRTTELGLAIISVNENRPHFCPGRSRFYIENHVQAFTIDIREGPSLNYESERLGETIRVETDTEAGFAMEKILAKFQDSGRRRLILVGYDMYSEFQWISEQYPLLAPYFTAWVDVQELMASKCKVTQLGLTDALRALGIADNRHNLNRHSAANDAVRNLAVLAGILSGSECTIELLPDRDQNKIRKYTSLPHARQIGPTTRYPFTAHVGAVDGIPLPVRTPKELSTMYAGYSLKAVGVNSKTRRLVTIWWMAFHTLESLKSFMLDIEGSNIEGKILKVVQTTGL
jgi:hypothetical protein